MMSSIAMEEEEEEEEEHQEQRLSLPETSSSSMSSPPPSLFSESEAEEDEALAFLSPPTTWGGSKRRILTKQLSMRETKMELKWEKRRTQMSLLRRPSEKSDGMVSDGKGGEVEVVKGRPGRVRSLTDEDLDELRGSIDLGFGFSEEVDGGHDLCRTLPALNLYFAVNRQLSDPKMRSPASSTPTTTTSSASTLYGTPSPRSFNDQPQEEQQQQQGRSNILEADAWKIFNPGDSPQHVKTRLRHWAQIVACSVRQCC